MKNKTNTNFKIYFALILIKTLIELFQLIENKLWFSQVL